MPKSSRSPLYFYADDYRRHRQRTAGEKLTIHEAIAACYDEWKALPEQEKQVYKKQYDEWRVSNRANPSPSQLKAPKKSEESLRQRDIPCAELKNHYDRFGAERTFLAYKYIPLDLSELLAMPIYVINFQVFCKIDPEDGGGYLPAEMCVLRYTLAEGVTIYRQRFLQTGKIPSGYMSACLEQSKETHQIPVSDFAPATDDYPRVYQELKSFLFPTMINRTPTNNEQDDRTRRRYLRLSQPCLFFPAFEYDQTCYLIDWLQEKAEGIKPTKETRLVNLVSLESLIMTLVELKEQRISREQIQRTFENAAYSFLIPQRCSFHDQIGLSHCAVARCHAGAKLLSAYLNQLYVPQRASSATFSERSASRTEHSSEEIAKLQRDNFHRLLSNADSIASSTARSSLTERRQVLLDALHNIEKQIDELDVE